MYNMYKYNFVDKSFVDKKSRTRGEETSWQKHE